MPAPNALESKGQSPPEHRGTYVARPTSLPEVTPAAYLSKWQMSLSRHPV